MAKLAVLAIGGNSLIEDETRQTVEDQLRAISKTVGYVMELIDEGLSIVITHGNGPQVGFILRRSEIAHESRELHPVPLKNCVADTQGAIGYQLQETLNNAFRRKGIKKTAVSMVTQVEVDQNDPSFSNPTKPIGSFYKPEKKQALEKANPEWKFMSDAGRGYRRVVPSPRPTKVVELDAIKSLVDQGFCVIAGGGGGIPSVAGLDGELKGVDGVVDKDLTSSILATDLGAELLIISTSVDKVYLDFGTDKQRSVDRMTVAQAREYLAAGQFGKGSMQPKILASVEFLEKGGKEAIITSPENLKKAYRHEAGTLIVP